MQADVSNYVVAYAKEQKVTEEISSCNLSNP